MANDRHINYVHSDGRKCIIGPDGVWRHWDHEQPEPGPREVRDYKCDRKHPNIISHVDDRGDFGMPTIGTLTFPTGTVFSSPDDFGASTAMPEFKMVITQKGISIDYGEQGVDADAMTPDAEYILAKVVPHMLLDFLQSNEKYARAQTGHDLGVKGIIPDINRKTSALITRIWDGAEAGRDSTEELIDDLIGHLLLMRAKMRG